MAPRTMVLLLLAPFSWIGCGGSDGDPADPLPPVPSSEDVAQEPVEPDPEQARNEQAAAAAPMQIGFDLRARPVEPPDPAARTANRAALEVHRARDYEAARAGFAEAIAHDPHYDIARFNLACALSRLSQHEAAARELTQLLRRDLPVYLPRLREDEDLQSMRQSEPGRSLLSEVPEIEAAWLAAIASGVPAAYKPDDTQARRYGFWLIDQHRFVPIVPSFSSSEAIIDVTRHRVAAIELGWVGDPGGPDETFVALSVVTSPFTPPGGSLSRVALTAEANLDHSHVPIDASADVVRFRYLQNWESIDGRQLDEASSQAAAAPRPHQRLPEGFRLRGNSLITPSSEEPIQLGSGHGAARWHSFALNAERSRIFVASERETESEQVAFEVHGHGYRTRFDSVDLRTGAVRRIGDVRRSGHVFAAGGDAYMIGDGPPRRFVAFAPDDVAEVPAGLTPLPAD